MQIVNSHRVEDRVDQLYKLAQQLADKVATGMGTQAQQPEALPEEGSPLASIHFIRALSYYHAGQPGKAIYHL